MQQLKGETATQARRRVIQSAERDPQGEWARVQLLIGTRPIQLVAAYAPQDARARIELFKNLEVVLSANTLVGIDANCVPDPILDQTSAKTANNGGTEMVALFASFGLTDVARENLGNKRLYTSHRRYKVSTDGQPDEYEVSRRRIVHKCALWKEKRRAWDGEELDSDEEEVITCLLYTSPSPRDGLLSRMPSSA